MEKLLYLLGPLLRAYPSDSWLFASGNVIEEDRDREREGDELVPTRSLLRIPLQASLMSESLWKT